MVCEHFYVRLKPTFYTSTIVLFTFFAESRTGLYDNIFSALFSQACRNKLLECEVSRRVLVRYGALALVLAFPHSQKVQVLCLNHPEGQGIRLVVHEPSATLLRMPLLLLPRSGLDKR